MIAWLLTCSAFAADISVPSDLDPLGWAQAWSHITQAMQDPSLDEVDLAWTRSDGRWVLTVELDTRRATVDGLVPAEDPEGRIEQLFVALGLVLRTGPAPADPQSALRSRLAPPPEPTPEPEPKAPEPVVVPKLLPTSLAPPPAVPPEVVRISVVDLLPTEVKHFRESVALLFRFDSERSFGVVGQWLHRVGPLFVGARGGARLDRDVHAANGEDVVAIPIRRLVGRSFDLRFAAEGFPGRLGLGIGGSLGFDVRRLSLDRQFLGRGVMPVVGAHMTYVRPGRLGFRAELGWTRDLRALGIVAGGGPVFLPRDRIELTVGVSPGRRS
ncbi:MAG: hypothetical protein AAGA48_07170 [Myxococcota bacterium]